MDYVILKAELTGANYINLSDAEAADLLNAPTINGYRSITVGELAGYVLLEGIWPAIEAAQSHQDAQVAAVAKSAIALMSNPAIQKIELNDPVKRAKFSALLDVLVTATVVTEEQKQGAIDLGVIQISRAAELRLGTVLHYDVSMARRI